MFKQASQNHFMITAALVMAKLVIFAARIYIAWAWISIAGAWVSIAWGG